MGWRKVAAALVGVGVLALGYIAALDLKLGYAAGDSMDPLGRVSATTKSTQQSGRYVIWNNVIADTVSQHDSLYYWVGDSSDVIPTGDLSESWLAVRVLPDSGSATPSCRIGIQLRAHTTAGYDSSDTYVGQMVPFQAAITADSIAFGRVTPSITGPGSGGLSLTASKEVYGQLGLNPAGRYIPLCFNGVWWHAPYTSIRVWVLSSNGTISFSHANPSHGKQKVNVRVSLIGLKAKP